MRKRMACMRCGKNVDENMSNCPYCGNTRFEVVGIDENSNYDDYNENINVQKEIYSNKYNMKDGVQKNSSVNSKKPLSSTQKAMVVKSAVLAGVIVIAFIVTFITKYTDIGKNRGNSSSENNNQQSGVNDNTSNENDSMTEVSDNEQTEDDNASDIIISKNYTSGKVVNGVYTNEWLGIRVKLPDGYENEKDEYEYYEDETTKCGFCGMNSEGSTIVNLYMDCKNNASYTPKNALDDSIQGMGNTVDEYKKISRENVILHNIDYIVEHAELSVDDEKIYLSYYVGKKDNYIIMFYLNNVDGDINDNKAFMESLK